MLEIAVKMQARLTPNTDTFYAAIVGVLMVVSKILRATVLMNTSRQIAISKFSTLTFSRSVESYYKFLGDEINGFYAL